MSDKAKEYFLKTLLVIGIILIFMIFPGSILLSFIFDETIFYLIFYTILGLTAIDGILFMVFAPIFGGIKSKPIKAEKIPLPFDSFTELSSFLSISLKEEGYTKLSKKSINEMQTITVYAKSGGLWVLNCVAIIRAPELNESFITNAEKAITEILMAYYGGKPITDTIHMLSVFCVDRITSTFQKLVDSPVRQGFKNGRLPVGVSFGGKNIYIAKQLGGFAVARYKRLRKTFLTLMRL